MAKTQSVRSPNATHKVCLCAVRKLFGFNTVAYVEQNCGHTLRSFERISNVLVTYHYVVPANPKRMSSVLGAYQLTYMHTVSLTFFLRMRMNWLLMVSNIKKNEL